MTRRQGLFIYFCFSASLSLCSTALGQGLSFGVIAGSNLTDDVQSGRVAPGRNIIGGNISSFIVDPGARRPILGLKAEYQLPRSWAVEFNALHREWKSTETTIYSPPFELPGGRTISTMGPFTRTLTTWEFPIFAKYRLPLRKAYPFLAVGPSFRPAGTGTGLSHAGITVAGGTELNVSGFRIAPTLRYTRWSSANVLAFGGPLVNQVECLVGVDRPAMTSGVSAFGRRLSVGVLAGIGLGEDFKADSVIPIQIPEANSGIFGVMIEMPLPKGWVVEVNGLYRPLHGSESEFGHQVRFAHLTWEFPVLLKHRFLTKSRFTVVAEGGPSFRAEGNLNLQPVSHYGATVGAGVETKLGPFRVSPVMRYTRWAGETRRFRSHTWANQTQVLISFAI